MSEIANSQQEQPVQAAEGGSVRSYDPAQIEALTNQILEVA
jgi:hypothetical protein